MTVLPPAGWYPAPGEPGQERRWTGSAWTEERRHALDSSTAQRSWLERHLVAVLVALGCVLGVGAGVAVVAGYFLAQGADEAADLGNTAWIEREVAPQVDEQVSEISGEPVRGSVLECPAHVEWEVGATFRCSLTVPGADDGYVKVTMLSEAGQYSWYASNP